MRQLHALLLLGVLTSAGCDFEDTTNPNSPDPIGANPTRAEVANAATGMLLAFRTDFADFALDMGIIGRELYRFDGSDPRFTGELLLGPLDPGGEAFGGDFDYFSSKIDLDWFVLTPGEEDTVRPGFHFGLGLGVTWFGLLVPVLAAVIASLAVLVARGRSSGMQRPRWPWEHDDEDSGP